MTVLIFGVGVLVTLLVTSALGLLVWGAILDGRPVESEIHPAPAVVSIDRKGDAA
ncbi:MAG TPA: hypothetical protein VFL61_10020 [Gaiellaceae bacterium]|nr:hypothetical protein [Gaiellaceae bacterium]